MDQERLNITLMVLYNHFGLTMLLMKNPKVDFYLIWYRRGISFMHDVTCKNSHGSFFSSQLSNVKRSIRHECSLVVVSTANNFLNIGSEYDCLKRSVESLD